MRKEDIVRSFAEVIRSANKKKTSSYDTTAKVVRVEGDVAWVHIPGGVDETPVKKTIACKAGDEIQVRVGGGRAWIGGNATAPPTDDTKADIAQVTAVEAKEVASDAIDYATTAQEAADSAVASATQAEEAAGRAQTSATNANEYASRALGHLATVQDVAETLNWITEHGTMTLTTDSELDPTHVYFVADANGDYVVGNARYSLVNEPSVDALSTYYVLSIDESLNNYVATHLALTSEGLWVLPSGMGSGEDMADSNGNTLVTAEGDVLQVAVNDPQLATGYKVLIATGQGSIYTTAGTYIIDASGDVVASFLEDGVQIGRSGDAHVQIDSTGMRVINAEGATAFEADIDSGQISSTIKIPSRGIGLDIDSAKASGVRYSFEQTYDVSNATPGELIELVPPYRPIDDDPILQLAYIRIERGVMEFSTESAITSNISVEAETFFILQNTLRVYIPYSERNTYSFTAGTSKTVTGSATGIIWRSQGTGYTLDVTFVIDYDATEKTIKEKISMIVYAPNNTVMEVPLSLTLPALRYQCVTTAPAFTFGTRREDTTTGLLTATIGEGLEASESNQTAIGKYNDCQSDTAFEIGNGEDDENRSNAFAVKWTGQIVTPALQRGYISVSNISAHNYADHVVTFDVPFPTTPTVVAGFYSQSSGAGSGSIMVGVHSKSTTGFTARVFNNDDATRSPDVEWIAMA